MTAFLARLASLTPDFGCEGVSSEYKIVSRLAKHLAPFFHNEAIANPGVFCSTVSEVDVTNTGHDMFCPGLSLDADGRAIVSQFTSAFVLNSSASRVVYSQE